MHLRIQAFRAVFFLPEQARLQQPIRFFFETLAQTAIAFLLSLQSRGGGKA
jgi:hypothetical protein